MDENKSQTLHVTGILIYRIQRQVEFLLLNDSFSHKKHWTAPKGNVIGSEDELKCAIRNTIEITGLSVKDLRIEDNFRVEIKYLSGTRPKRVVYYLAQINDYARIFTAGEGLNIHWLSLNHAIEKAVYRSMQDVLRQAASFIESNKSNRNSDSQSRPRIEKQQGHSDRLESRFKVLNLALPLDSQRQAMSRQRLEQQREQRQQNSHRAEKNGNGYSSPLHSPVMPFENPLYKTRLCERFETEGFCPYRLKCTFAHGTVELRERPLTEDKVSMPPTSKDGPENPLYKTRLCERFMKEGFCQYGPKCNFAHGEDELRERPVITHRDNRDCDPVEQNQGDQNQDDYQHREVENEPVDEQDVPEHLEEEQERRQFPNRSQRQFQQRPTQIDSPKRSPPATTHMFPRSEIQNGIFGRIAILTAQDPLGGAKSRQASVAQARSGGSSDTEKEHRSRDLKDGLKDANGVSTFKDGQVDRNDLEQKEQDRTPANNQIEPKERDHRETLPTGPTQTSKLPGGVRRRPAVNDTVTLKDLLSGDAKPENDKKSWMKVVELSNDDLAKLGSIKKNDLPAPNSDKRSQEDTLVSELKRFLVQFKEQAKPLSDEIKEITRIEMRHDLSKQQLFNIVIRSLYEEGSWDTVEKDLTIKEKLFKTFIRSSQDQVTFLKCWEKFLNQRNTNLLPKAPLLFKTLYDKDYIEEESVLVWYEDAKDTSEVRKKCTIFVNWLKEAEEEDSD